MELLTIEILNPEAKKVLQGLADMHFIKISQNTENEDIDENSWSSLTTEQQDGIFKAMNEIDNDKGIPHKAIIAEFQNKYQNG